MKLQALPGWLMVALLGLGGAGCETPREDAKAAIERGLSRALSDEELGPLASLRQSDSPTDSLAVHSVPRLLTGDSSPFIYRSETVWTLAISSGAAPRTERVVESVEVEAASATRWEMVRSRRIRDRFGVERTHTRRGRFVDGTFYVEGARGGWSARSPMREEHVEWSRTASETLPTLVEALGSSLQRSNAAGRVRLGLASTTGRAPAQGASSDRNEPDQWSAWWRRAHRVEEIEGTVTVDDALGCPTEGSLRLAATMGDERSGRLEISHDFSTDRGISAPRIRIPKFVVSSGRQRIFRDIRRILKPFRPETDSGDGPRELR